MSSSAWSAAALPRVHCHDVGWRARERYPPVTTGLGDPESLLQTPVRFCTQLKIEDGCTNTNYTALQAERFQGLWLAVRELECDPCLLPCIQHCFSSPTNLVNLRLKSNPQRANHFICSCQNKRGQPAFQRLNHYNFWQNLAVWAPKLTELRWRLDHTYLETHALKKNLQKWLNELPDLHTLCLRGRISCLSYTSQIQPSKLRTLVLRQLFWGGPGRSCNQRPAPEQISQLLRNLHKLQRLELVFHCAEEPPWRLPPAKNLRRLYVGRLPDELSEPPEQPPPEQPPQRPEAGSPRAQSADPRAEQLQAASSSVSEPPAARDTHWSLAKLCPRLYELVVEGPQGRPVNTMTHFLALLTLPALEILRLNYQCTESEDTVRAALQNFRQHQKTTTLQALELRLLTLDGKVRPLSDRLLSFLAKTTVFPKLIALTLRNVQLSARTPLVATLKLLCLGQCTIWNSEQNWLTERCFGLYKLELRNCRFCTQVQKIADTPGASGSQESAGSSASQDEDVSLPLSLLAAPAQPPAEPPAAPAQPPVQPHRVPVLHHLVLANIYFDDDRITWQPRYFPTNLRPSCFYTIDFGNSLHNLRTLEIGVTKDAHVSVAALDHIISATGEKLWRIALTVAPAEDYRRFCAGATLAPHEILGGCLHEQTHRGAGYTKELVAMLSNHRDSKLRNLRQFYLHPDVMPDWLQAETLLRELALVRSVLPNRCVTMVGEPE